MGNEFLGEKLFSGLIIRRNGRVFHKKIIPTCQSTKVRLTCWNDLNIGGCLVFKRQLRFNYPLLDIPGFRAEVYSYLKKLSPVGCKGKCILLVVDLL